MTLSHCKLKFVFIFTFPTAPQAPQNTNFIVSNVTFVSLDLDRWHDGHCPISHFSIKYRVKDFRQSQQELGIPSSPWVAVSSHLKPEPGSLQTIRELHPATWYELVIVAHNDAGHSEAHFLFATLTLVGGTVQPLLMSSGGEDGLYMAGGSRRWQLGGGGLNGGGGDLANLLDDPMILIPATCALLVLLVVGGATAFIFIARNKDVVMAGGNGGGGVTLDGHCEYPLVGVLTVY